MYTDAPANILAIDSASLTLWAYVLTYLQYTMQNTEN